MKRLIPILLAVFAFAACEKDPDMDKLDNDYLVYTNYDKKADYKHSARTTSLTVFSSSEIKKIRNTGKVKQQKLSSMRTKKT